MLSSTGHSEWWFCRINCRKVSLTLRMWPSKDGAGREFEVSDFVRTGEIKSSKSSLFKMWRHFCSGLVSRRAGCNVCGP